MTEAMTPAPTRPAGSLVPAVTAATGAVLAPELLRPLHEAERLLLGAAVRGAPLGESLAELVRTCERILPDRMVSVMLVDGPRLRQGAGPSLPDGYLSATDGLPIGEGYGSCGAAVHRREPVLIDDLLHDPLWANYRELAARYGLGACWSLPFFSGAGEVLGTLAIYARSPCRPSPDELHLGEEIGRITSLVVEASFTRDGHLGSESRLDEMVDELDAIVWRASPEGRTVERISPALAERLGLPAVPGRSGEALWRDRVHPDDREVVSRIVTEVARRARFDPGRSFEYQYRLTTRDGGVIWVREFIRAEPGSEVPGRAARVRGLMVNVSKQREAEQAREDLLRRLALEQSLLRAVIDQLPEAAAVVSPNGRLIIANRAMEAVMNLRLRPDLVVAEEFRNLPLFFPDGRQCTPEEWPLTHALAGRTVRDVVLDYVDGDGVRRSLRINAAPVRDEDDALLAAVIVLSDITEQARATIAQRLLVDAGAILAGSRDGVLTARQVAAMAVDNFADWVWVLMDAGGDGLTCAALEHREPDKAPDLGLVNQLLTQPGALPFHIHAVLASSRSELLAGRSFDELDGGFVAPELAALLRGLGIETAITVPLSSPAGIFGAIVFVSAGRATPLGPNDLPVAEELARRVSLSMENARLFEGAQKAIRHREEFLSIAAHELRTPLASLRLSVQTIAAHLEQSELNLEFLKARARAGDRCTTRLERLMNELLDVAVIQLGRMRLVREGIDLVATVQSALAYLRAEIHNRSIDVAVHAAGPILGSWDPTRLEQVMTNLISNAIKYGQGRPIRLWLRATADTATIEVEDSGIGMATDLLPRLFQPFERGVSAGHYGGLGLGLYIAHQIVRAHAGSISVRSTLGQGSVFTVELPRRAPV